jgi:UDP-N-acetylglucosamine 2-epimerase (non-hydrolysing)
MKRILFIFGTRPEAIKVVPVIQQLKTRDSCRRKFEAVICVTAQHRQMLDQVLKTFRIHSDYDLNIMEAKQSLYDITVKTLSRLEKLMARDKFDLVLVHGDTTTTLTAALAAFYQKIPVGHIEAGLRSYDKFNPYPEEVNRILTDAMCDLYFAPTLKARQSLIKENIPEEKIYVTGNTVIDTLYSALEVKHRFNNPLLRKILSGTKSRILLVTAHRRENFGAPIKNICHALKAISRRHPDLHIVYPVHLNPNITKPVYDILGDVKRIHLVPPLDYLDFINLMKKSYIVLTDSGGLQEEAPALGKPVLVSRIITERPEGIKTGTVKIVGVKKEIIIREVSALLKDRKKYLRMSTAVNPYGDGKAGRRIIEAIRYYFGFRSGRPKDFVCIL